MGQSFPGQVTPEENKCMLVRKRRDKANEHTKSGRWLFSGTAGQLEWG